MVSQVTVLRIEGRPKFDTCTILQNHYMAVLAKPLETSSLYIDQLCRYIWLAYLARMSSTIPRILKLP
jgi:hypothetical protein